MCALVLVHIFQEEKRRPSARRILESDWLRLSAEETAAKVTLIPQVAEKRTETYTAKSNLDTEMDIDEESTSSNASTSPKQETDTMADADTSTDFLGDTSINTSTSKRPVSSPPSRPESMDGQSFAVRRVESQKLHEENDGDTIDAQDGEKKEVKEEASDDETMEDDVLTFAETLQDCSESYKTNTRDLANPTAPKGEATLSHLRTDRTDLSHPSELSIRGSSLSSDLSSGGIWSAPEAPRPIFGGLLHYKELENLSLRHLSKEKMAEQQAEGNVGKGLRKGDGKLSTSDKGKSERTKTSESSHLSRVSAVFVKGSKRGQEKGRTKDVQPAPHTEKDKLTKLLFRSLPQMRSSDEVKKKGKAAEPHPSASVNSTSSSCFSSVSSSSSSAASSSFYSASMLSSSASMSSSSSSSYASSSSAASIVSSAIGPSSISSSSSTSSSSSSAPATQPVPSLVSSSEPHTLEPKKE